MNVLFYQSPPWSTSNIDDVYQFCKERLAILKVFDKPANRFNSPGNHNFFSALKSQIMSASFNGKDNFLKVLLCCPHSMDDLTRKEALTKDRVSHFVLRLFYSSQRSLSTWFVEKESELLRFRLMDNVHNIADFIQGNSLPFEEISEDCRNLALFPRDKPQSKIDHNNAMRKFSVPKKLFQQENLFTENFNDPPKVKRMNISGSSLKYRVPFELALDLVKGRKVVINQGYVTLKCSEMVPVLCQLFRDELIQCMDEMRVSLLELDESRRLIPLLGQLHEEMIGYRHDITGDKRFLGKGLADELVIDSFPPCMLNLHRNLVKNKHLRHHGRLQYALFLKSLGLRLDELLKIFEKEFTKQMSEEKFRRKYNYFFRYIYGQVGKRTDFSCFSCKKIINCGSLGPKDYHGCPFKDLDARRLQELLNVNCKNVADAKTEQIMELCQKNEYQNACSMFFEVKHRSRNFEGTIYHPKQFYVESRKHLQNLGSNY